MALQEIINGLRSKIQDVNPEIELFFHSPTAHVDDFPFIVFDVDTASQNDYMGTSADPVAVLAIAFFSDADKGSASLRTIEESVHTALHKQEFTAENHTGTATWSLERGNAEIIQDVNALGCIDTYTIFGSET